MEDVKHFWPCSFRIETLVRFPERFLGELGTCLYLAANMLVDGLWLIVLTVYLYDLLIDGMYF